MAKVQGTFYTGERLRRGTSPVSPPYLGEDGQPYPVNPPGSGTSIGYLTLSDVDDSTYTDKDWNTPVVDESIGKLKLRPYVRDTGVIAFDGAVYNSATTVDIGAIKAFIADNETDPLNPTLVYKEYAGATGVSVTTVGTGTSSYAYLKSDGTIHFENTFPTSDKRKSMVFLFKVGHPAGSITIVANEPDFNNSALQQFRDLFQAFNYVNGGVYPYPDAADLSFNTTGGLIVGNGINFVNDNTIPNDLTVAPAVPCSFLYRTQTGVGGGLVSLLDPTQYDVAGTITAVGGGSNRSTLQYLLYAPNAGFLMQYGQNVYDTLIEAIAAVGKEDLVIYEPLVKNAILIGVFALNRTATNLTDESKARVFKADIFGQLVGSAAGTSVTTLQRAYLNSIIPQIETTIGALTLKNGGAADTDSVVSIQNLAAAETFKVTGAGNTTANSFVKSGGTSGQYLKADGSTSGISPYDLAQVGAADGDKLTWVAANSRYEPVSGGGGGADTNSVHYNAADGKTASEKQQARDNLGLDTGIPQLVATTGTINNLAKTSNFIKFTGAGSVTLTGIVADQDGAEVTIQNETGNNLTFSANDVLSSAGNRFDFSIILPDDQIFTIRYNGTDSIWSLKYESWLPIGSGIYRNSQVAIGRTSLGASSATLAINALGSGAGFPIILGHDSSGVQVMNISKEGWFGSGLNPTTSFEATRSTSGTATQLTLRQTGTAGIAGASFINSASKQAWIGVTSPSYAASLGNFFFISLLTTGTDIVIAPNLASASGGTEKIWFRCGGLAATNNVASFDLNGLTFNDAKNIIFNTTTGSKIGTSTSQKLAFWNKTPIIQPTNAITAAAFVTNTSGTVNDSATFGGYTIGQIAAALINVGILA